ncbi:hypothetical protein K9N68_10805 [Kovacikia minuta CCNUW1]|uniref:hypothetical protein n=1 Tax=Kovacikia minuta TaxID=2931930 RepID=UPI001CC94315|nr:hypothetical protein [Kovacikia minuta]UBF28318.1 hypothetical protein K9N68_10805 [Kovacikia minuta CCNUW1]
MSNKSEFHIPRGARPGEVWFFINLSQITSHTPDQVIDIVQSMGYSPQLRYIEQFVEGEKRLDVALLLHHEQLEPSTLPDEMELAVGAKLMDDWDELSIKVEPDLAVRIRLGRVPNPVAA